MPRSVKKTNPLEIWVERIWALATAPFFIGILLALTGAVVALTPLSASPESPARAWWVTAFRFSDATRTSATVLGVIVILMAGLFLQRFANRLFVRPRQITRWVPTIGIALMIGAGAGGAFAWFFTQTFFPPSRVVLAPGRKVQSIPTFEIGTSLNVMFQNQAQVDEIDVRTATAKMSFFRAGQEEGVTEVVQAGEPVVVGDYRFALVGFEYNPGFKRATIVPHSDKAIPQVVHTGDKVKFDLDGPEYEVKQIVTNYLRLLGPAVELTTEEGGTFWVFERETENTPVFGNGFRLSNVETAPIPVFFVSSARLGDWVTPLFITFVFGFLLIVLFRDETTDLMGEDFDSINELGAALEEQQ